MTLDQLAAGMFCIGFPGLTLPDEGRRLIDRGVSGVILFKRNVDSPQQFADLTFAAKRHAGRPLLTMTDQEGGRVQRLREPFTILPSAREVGRANDPKLAYELGRAMAAELKAVHIDIDLAPVLDVDSNPANPVIADRSFAADPAAVSAIGTAVIRGLQDGGVAACAKHFPGHGDTTQDSHHMLPRLDHTLARLQSTELVPFAAATAAGVASIMSAHVIFTPIDSKYPATMSEPVLSGILRRQMSYDGVVFSDDMEMKAIAEHYGLEEAIILGANAGIDCFLISHTEATQHRAIDILVAAVNAGRVPEARLHEAHRRLKTLAARYAKTPATAGAAITSAVGIPAHQATADAIRAAGKPGPKADTSFDPTLQIGGG